MVFETAKQGFEIKKNISQIDLKVKLDMAWQLSLKFFLMTLSSYIPQLIVKGIKNLFEKAISELKNKKTGYYPLGDSAGKIEPLFGNGISMAIQNPFKAFQMIEKHLNEPISTQNHGIIYADQWNCLFSNRIKTGNYIRQLGVKN